MKLDEYPGYTFDGEHIYNPKGKEVTRRKVGNGSVQFKMKNQYGKWGHLSYVRMRALTGNGLKMPKDATPLKRTKGYFITTKGIIYSFGRNHPQGVILKPHVGKSGYPKVHIKYKHQYINKDVHVLVAETFILDEYSKQGLCCLHRDDNKLHFHLSNLSIGTYSKNNKDSYKTGRNPGNGLKK